MDNLFKKLYQQGKQISKSGVFETLARKSKIKLESSIVGTVDTILDLQLKQKQMLCDIENFDHIEFWKIWKELIDLRQSLTVLEEILFKLFGEKQANTFGDVWVMIEEDLKKPQKKGGDEQKKDQ